MRTEREWKGNMLKYLLLLWLPRLNEQTQRKVRHWREEMAGREELWEPELWKILSVPQLQSKGRVMQVRGLLTNMSGES